MVDIQTTLADLVVSDPRAARVLHRHRLDFCCGGQRGFADACVARGLDPAALVGEIESEVTRSDAPVVEDLSPSDLTEFIVSRYHQPLREELPRLVLLAQRVERVHAEKPQCPIGLSDHLTQMQLSIEEHLDKEEQMLFPMIRGGRAHLAHMPVQVMIHEHHDHAANLRRMRELARDLALPAEACSSWRALYGGLEALELELMEHIHLENNVLFPRVLAA